MRLVVQRVSQASVSVAGEEVGRIGRGLLVLVGCRDGDTADDAEYCCRKLLGVRLFDDEKEGKAWALSVQQANLQVLLVSQFTLFAALKGNKPSFHRSMPPGPAKEFYDAFRERVKAAYAPDKVADGVFGAKMDVALNNDGPVTIVIDSGPLQE